MDFISSLTNFQIASAIILVISIPLLLSNLRQWRYAKESERWPTAKGVVVKGLDFTMSGALQFLYTFEVNGRKFEGKKPFFSNSFKNLGSNKTKMLISTYPEGKEVIVYYNPEKPAISTLEPGRANGMVSSMIILMLMLGLSIISLYDPTIISNMIN